MTRVALDATPLLGRQTGIATFTQGLIRALIARADVAVSVHAMSLRGVRRLRSVVPTGSRVVSRPVPASVLTRAWQHLDWPYAELIAGEADVMHGTNYVVGPTRRAAAVVTVYDLTAVRFPDLVERASLRYPELVRRAAARGALVHVTARAIGDEVVALLDVDPEQVRVVPSGVDDVVPGDRERGRRLAGGDRYVLAIGTVEPRKGFVELVSAFAATASTLGDDVRLVFAGPDGWATDDLVRAVDRSAARRRIRRLGWVSDRDRADLLAGAAALAVPSRYEGFGYPPLEAMLAGVPVVATRTGSLPEVLGDAALFVTPGDVDALSEALRSVLDDGDVAHRLRDAGPRHAAAFSWDACANAMVDVYADAIRLVR
jgi:glycosyltransferase involved in cell wall biosynthesis